MVSAPCAGKKRKDSATPLTSARGAERYQTRPLRFGSATVAMRAIQKQYEMDTVNQFVPDSQGWISKSCETPSSRCGPTAGFGPLRWRETARWRGADRAQRTIGPPE